MRAASEPSSTWWSGCAEPNFDPPRTLTGTVTRTPTRTLTGTLTRTSPGPLQLMVAQMPPTCDRAQF